MDSYNSLNIVLSPVDRWVGKFEKNVVTTVEDVARRIPFVGQPILGTVQIVTSVALMIIFSVLGAITCSTTCWDIVFHAGRHLGHGCLNVLTIVSDALILGLLFRIPFRRAESPWAEAASAPMSMVPYGYPLHLIDEERKNDEATRKALTEMQNDINYRLFEQYSGAIVASTRSYSVQRMVSHLVGLMKNTKVEEINLEEYQLVSQQIRNKSIITYFNMERECGDYEREVKIDDLIKYFLHKYKKHRDGPNPIVYPPIREYNESEIWLGRPRVAPMEPREVQEEELVRPNRQERLEGMRQALDAFKRANWEKIAQLEELVARAHPIVLSADLELKFTHLNRLLNTNLQELENAPEATFRAIEDLIHGGVFMHTSGAPNEEPAEFKITEFMDALINEYNGFIEDHRILIQDYEAFLLANQNFRDNNEVDQVRNNGAIPAEFDQNVDDCND